MKKVTLQTVFTDKVIICGVAKEDLEKFMTFFLEQAWIASKVPGEVRKVKESKNPSIAALYDTFDVKTTVKRAIDRGALFIEKIGPIYMGLKIHVNVGENTATPSTKIEIDKFVYERDDRYRDLEKFLREMIKVWEKLNVQAE